MTSLTRWDPFRDLVVLQNEMDRLLDNSLRMTNGWPQNGGGYWTPAIDAWETEDEFIIEATLPGIEPDNVDISVVNNMLTLQGQVQREGQQGQIRLRERQYGPFYRSIQLPSLVDRDNIQANYHNGVLTLHVPKAEEAKPKRIQVHSNGHAIHTNGQRVIEAQPS